jgi:hypothetical protein
MELFRAALLGLLGSASIFGAFFGISERTRAAVESVAPQVSPKMTIPGAQGTGRVTALRREKPRIVVFASNHAGVKAGAAATLRWEVSNAATVTIDNGVGTLSASSGIIEVRPTQKTRFTLTARNRHGAARASVDIGAVHLVQLAPNLYQTEHALFFIPSTGLVRFPDWNSVYSPANRIVYTALLRQYFPGDYVTHVYTANNLQPNMVPRLYNGRRLADGIDDGALALDGLPNQCLYNIGGGTVLDSAFGVLDHEMGHNWGARLGIEVASGHWHQDSTSTGQLATSFSDDGYVTIKQIVSDGGELRWEALDNTSNQERETYSYQDLYAMGLHPVFATVHVVDNAIYNPDGTVSGTVREYDHSWAVTRNGPRVPAYDSSPKKFRFGFIYIARDLAEVESVHVQIENSIDQFVNAEAVDTSRFRFQVPFLVATKHRGSGNALLADLDGNSTPTIALTRGAYFRTSDRSANVPFSASDPDGPAPRVSLVPAHPRVQIVNNEVHLRNLSPGTHFFTIKAEDANGKKSFEHFVVDSTL